MSEFLSCLTWYDMSMFSKSVKAHTYLDSVAHSEDFANVRGGLDNGVFSIWIPWKKRYQSKVSIGLGLNFLVYPWD